ncbi:formate dehydrogenase beta subunit [Rhodobaculum claviforme]|uniref:Formate dehydrogenase n=1 Tax=Rhodobaculum claviforme TaxID=1549854 RepID=A0A934TM20_9RHOB|nr:formate dehydrogenase beta subunit [Rhodobaculum claviforme]MBK5927513.1 formate dehydrogenase [Rhodobaculum claviforme]
MRVFLSRDASARALGAEAVATAIRAAAPGVELVRTGSRGMVWLEPLLEVETPDGRLAFGPLAAGDVPALFAGGVPGAGHPRCLGPTEDLPWMARQTRLTFARCGVIAPLSPDDYAAHGGLTGLRRALAMEPAAITARITDSGLRGRGGAGFPTGVKWDTVRTAPTRGAPSRKYIVCNADEGDSGTFADRMLMEGDPFCLIEGMVIAGLATGAERGFVYLRSEYPDAVAVMRAAVVAARAATLLGPSVLGSGRAFDIEVRVGAGSYVCGEETALLNSLEGKRPVVRSKPPLPALEGVFGQPTVVNNVITLASVPAILAQGAAGYRDLGIGRSRGTIPLQISGNVRRGGLLEVPFGLTLSEIVDDIAGGTASGRPVRAVQVGGPLGAYFPRALFDTPFGYEEYAARDGLIGHAGIVVFDDTVDMLEQARFAMEFTAHESCGKCTPCRIGAVRGVEVLDRLAGGAPGQEALLRDLCEVMAAGSLCALGGLAPVPVLSALTHFPQDFARERTAA